MKTPAGTGVFPKSSLRLRQRTIVLLLLLLCLSFGLVVSFKSFFLKALGHSLVEDDQIQRADAAVVLGGDEFGQRILKAAQLQREGFVPLVLVSGPPYLDLHESDFTIPFALRHGYPDSRLQAVPNHADSTRSESKILGVFLRQHGIARILLVTSNFHTRRAGKLMRLINPDLQVYVVPAPDPTFDPDSWWRTRDGRKTFLNEVLKTIAMELGD